MSLCLSKSHETWWEVAWGAGSLSGVIGWRTISCPTSYLWDRAPERGGGCLGGGQSWMPLRAVVVATHPRREAGDTRAWQRLLGDRQRMGSLGLHPSLWRVGTPSAAEAGSASLQALAIGEEEQELAWTKSWATSSKVEASLVLNKKVTSGGLFQPKLFSEFTLN